MGWLLDAFDVMLYALILTVGDRGPRADAGRRAG